MNNPPDLDRFNICWKNVEPHSRRRWVFIKLNKFLERILLRIGLEVRIELSYAGSYFLWERRRGYHYDQDGAASDANFLLKFLPRDSICLDVGCGPGRVERALAEFEKGIYAVDMSRTASRIAGRLLRDRKNVFIHTNNGRDLRHYGDASFDAVFSLSTFIHMSQERAMVYLFEIFRVLRPGGVALIEFQDLASEMEQFVYNAATQHQSVYRVRYYTRDALSLMCNRAGFQAISIDTSAERPGSMEVFITKG
jgi:SAM-dependent methyltransferase